MRDILFRGKRVDNGEWVYGSFIPDLCELLYGDKLDGFIKPFGKIREERLMVEVDRKTVGQYTGLTDKNGAKIFEGDICEVCLGIDTFYTGVIYYDERVAAFGIDYNNGKCNLLLDILRAKGIDTWINVIGNIHDNPELLEGRG